MFNCEVDLSTILTGILLRCHFLHYSNSRKTGSAKCSILTANSEHPFIYEFKLVRKGFLGTACADEVQLTRVGEVGTVLSFNYNRLCELSRSSHPVHSTNKLIALRKFNWPDKEALMLIKYSETPSGRAFAGTWSFKPWFFHLKFMASFVTTNCSSPTTSTPRKLL